MMYFQQCNGHFVEYLLKLKIEHKIVSKNQMERCFHTCRQAFPNHWRIWILNTVKTLKLKHYLILQMISICETGNHIAMYVCTGIQRPNIRISIAKSLKLKKLQQLSYDAIYLSLIRINPAIKRFNLVHHF